jgi:galactose oxidase-like protein
MYLPDSVVICGGYSPGDNIVGSPNTYTFGSNGTNPMWAQVASAPSGRMATRANHNLVTLPTGEVLVTGGLSQNPSHTIGDTIYAIKRPQIWNPGNRVWTPTTQFAEEPAYRDYHSTAVLLPDARILCAGGEDEFGGGGSNRCKYNTTIYEPYYLFDRNNPDSLAVRPVIDAAPKRVGWTQRMTVLCPDAGSVSKVCLIRPGAVTHAFNQNQRFLPLTVFQSTTVSPPRLFVTFPADGKNAPPGDYMLFVVSADSVPSIASWVRLGGTLYMDAVDNIRPYKITDLTGCPHYGQGTADLMWTAPSDDSTQTVSGPCTAYDIRYSSTHITSSTNWNNLSSVSGPIPGTAGSSELLTFTMPSPAGLYYFRMKAKDDNGHWSDMSNETYIDNGGFADCTGGGDGMFAGGGEGGGGSLVGGQGTVSLGSESSGPMENSVLNGASVGSAARDVYRLRGLAVSAEGKCSARVREGDGHAASVDAVRLVTVDHSDGVTAYPLGSSFALGTVQSASRVATPDGTDLTASLAGGNAAALSFDDTLIVDLGDGAGARPLVVEASGDGAIDVLVNDTQSGWRAVGRTYPRTGFDSQALSPPGGDEVRLVCAGSTRVRSIGSLSLVSESPILGTSSMVSANETHLGDVHTETATLDSSSTVLVGPDTLSLVYSVEPVGSGLTRDYFLLVNATLLNPKSLEPLSMRHGEMDAPVRFALRQNQPNPFHSGTTIGFDLPIGQVVQLEIFDAQGRLVRQLVNRFIPAGYQSAFWDKRDSGGNTVSPGVFFYRLRSDVYRDRKKMVLLP